MTRALRNGASLLSRAGGTHCPTLTCPSGAKPKRSRFPFTFGFDCTQLQAGNLVVPLHFGEFRFENARQNKNSPGLHSGHDSFLFRQQQIRNQIGADHIVLGAGLGGQALEVAADQMDLL